jgi:TPR repeat protein
MLEHGIACEIDYERSQALYESAAQCGHTGAQMYLATLALMTADYTRAVTWLEQAAHAGLPEAQAFLVRLLSTGPQAVRNKPTALFWSLIAQQADAESVQSIQAFKNCLDSVVASATEAEIDLAKNKIISWHKERHMNPTSTETQQAGGNII